jgi:hypothetical protein
MTFLAPPDGDAVAKIAAPEYQLAHVLRPFPMQVTKAGDLRARGRPARGTYVFLPQIEKRAAAPDSHG